MAAARTAPGATGAECKLRPSQKIGSLRGNPWLALVSNDTARKSPLDREVCRPVFLQGRSISISGFAAIVGLTFRPLRTAGVPAGSGPSLWRQALRPCSLALFGLALVVALSSFSHQLFLFHCHRIGPMRSDVIRLWIESPGAALRIKTRMQPSARLHALSRFHLRLPSPGAAPVVQPPALAGGVPSLDFTFPLRSPPARLFPST